VFFGGAPLTEAARQRITQTWVGDGPLYFWENYSSIESLFGHSFRRDWPGMIFSPFESVLQFSESADQPSFLRLDELEAGMKVQVFLTNQAGLVNYRMNDVVEILSHRPLTFRFVGRAFDQVSLSYERITTVDADEAFSAFARAFPQAEGDFVLWLEEGPPARVVWALPTAIDGAADALDHALRQRNVSYARLRASGFYAEARVQTIDGSVFRAYRARHLHRGVFKEKKIFQDRSAFDREYVLC
jgi:hypothetical protein